ncbi:elongation factor G, putative [Eimeria brunetti]|uniref:Elongation factor G, putative n=1 Tax=Eimeria brunetti TaxID=51314 RepID=U6LBY3_9EIME|nr:elongation factor G, putative [Eimeria brunetti]
MQRSKQQGPQPAAAALQLRPNHNCTKQEGPGAPGAPQAATARCPGKGGLGEKGIDQRPAQALGPRFFSSSSGGPQGAPPEDPSSRIRNIGISAHIDSGKTTLTERILFYTGRIAEIHEVRGSDGVGAKMDSMELEREKGITIQSAASYCSWALPEDPAGGPPGGAPGGPYTINLIDTPGHVDFTVEVERALRVLDGAILVVCGVAGVQSQTLTVDRQMRRYGVPRLIFVNKLDRDGADPWRALEGIRKKLNLNAYPIQIPIGTENKHQGVIDLVSMEAVYFKGEKGQQAIRTGELPEGLAAEARRRRSDLVEGLAEKDETLAEVYIHLGEAGVSAAQLHQAIRTQTLSHNFIPLLMGSAKGNKGVQPLLDAVCRYLPAPGDRVQVAKDLDKGEAEVELSCDPKKPLVAMAFKIQELPIGQLTYLRLYQGSLKRGETVLDLSTSKKQQVKRLLRMNADEAREVQQAAAGDIVAAGGLVCCSGVTLTDGKPLALNSMHVAEPVVSLAVKVDKKEHQAKFAKALNRFQREDPTFRDVVGGVVGRGIVGMVGVTVVVVRIIGGIVGMVGNDIPPNFIASVERGFFEAARKGPLIGAPLVNTRFVLEGGKAHDVDSSDLAFRLAAAGALRAFALECLPVVLEPIMVVEVVVPREMQAAALMLLNRREGTVSNCTLEGDTALVSARVPLRCMFSFVSELRAHTQGQGEFSMTFEAYEPMQQQQQQLLLQQHQQQQQQQQQQRQQKHKA